MIFALLGYTVIPMIRTGWINVSFIDTTNGIGSDLWTGTLSVQGYQFEKLP